MARRPDLPCAGCGSLLWRGSTSLPEGRAMCRPCRRVQHGTAGYRRGCRCAVCSAANGERRRASAKTCESCDRPAAARGMCQTHYSYWYRREVSGEWRGSRTVDVTVRLAVYERDAWTCHLCGEPVDRDADVMRGNLAPSVDHLIPVSRGGGSGPENLATAHRICNSLRGAKPLEV